ncbi:hypothetical protein SNOG_15680 [Parastagonospora nodorum SN15]|uniref:Uncharacterized protein n=1 Tax=Phaeosphaeria nodorum (strain SN15 / ATCC MYA-4574 / FGSC 10173) TaxID=321614 RepID=Q0TY55_PHANO|nr:hypothetical protein SNOG_15680 [Parastagonospora nodorum SN15]EAT77055.1 hypothetical protein SNOG_15680 [Parastagonospora nodorum SN15]
MTSTAKRDSMDATVDGIKTKLQAAQLAEPTPKKRALGLVDLPASVRNNIYKYALDTELVNVGEPNVSYTHSIKDGVLEFKASRSPFRVQTALFYVNKQISKEALNYFYSKNLFVKFDIYSADARHAKTMLEDSGLLFSTASPDSLENSKQHALELVLVEKNSSQKRASVIFPAQYLPRLINFLSQASQTTKSWAPAHSVFINLVNTYNFSVSRIQGDLLEIFRLLSNLGGATVDANGLLPRYAEAAQSHALSLSTDSPSPTDNPWFKSLPVELIPPNKLTWFTDLERAQTWYALGMVHAALGENLFAAGDMERALELWGDSDGKEKVENAFEKIRETIDEQREEMFKGQFRPGSGLNRAGRIARMHV